MSEEIRVVTPEELTAPPEFEVTVAKRFYTGLEGVIKNAEIVETRFGRAVRVTVVGNDGQLYGEMLWVRDIVGETSKLGAFITALGKKPKEWIGKKIKFISWEPANRKIAVIP
jgi:hypothetical protein